MRKLTVKILPSSWISNMKSPRDTLYSPKGIGPSCDCASRLSTAAYKKVCLHWYGAFSLLNISINSSTFDISFLFIIKTHLYSITENFDSIMAIQQLTPKQPEHLSADQAEALKIHNEGQYPTSPSPLSTNPSPSPQSSKPALIPSPSSPGLGPASRRRSREMGPVSRSGEQGPQAQH